MKHQAVQKINFKEVNTLKYLLIVIISCISLLANAEENSYAEKDTVEAWDNSKVDYRHPSRETIDHYSQQSEYQYHINTDALSWWRKFWAWVLSHIRISDGTFSILGWTILTLAILALLFLIIKLMGIPIKGLFVFSKSTKVTQLKFGQSLVDLEKEKLDEMLTLYINNQAFREATRVLFLLTLRRLNRKNLIKWNAYKTDREYYYEIKESSLKDLFLNIIRQYEFIWFGKFDITEPEFTLVKSEFDQFMNKLQNRKTN